MKILLTLGRYLPEKNGGIENYTHCLAKLLLKDGHSVEVAIVEGNEAEPYIYEEVQITPLNKGFESFKELIQSGHYEICHFQEYSAFGGIEMFWIKAARKYCSRIFFTFHLPYFTCYKNDFRYFGVEDCNNFSSPERCVKCVVATKSGYRKSTGFNLFNAGIRSLMPLLRKTSKIVSLQHNIEVNTNNLSDIIEYADKVFVIANWFKELLFYNNYTSPKIRLLPPLVRDTSDFLNNSNIVKKKLLFVGRIEKQKGLLVLCKAMKDVEVENIQIDVYGNIVDEIYFRRCNKEYAFNFNGTLSRQELLLKLSEYDFLILPSVFTEMYSMILQEALNAHLPAIVSAAKGNVDIIRDNRNGFIFSYDDHKNLAEVINKAYTLKLNGWLPEFEENNFMERDLEEILSYYS